MPLKPRFVIVALLIFVITVLPAAAQQPALGDVLPALPKADLAALVSKGELLLFHPDGVAPGLLPDTKLTATVEKRIVSGKLNIGIEGLFFTASKDLPDDYSKMPESERDLVMYNILRSVSTLQGLEYYSASREEMRLLFEESWVISDGKSATPVPDPMVKQIPAEDKIFIHQKDMSFGSNESEMTFRTAAGVFAADIVNLTPVRYKGMIKIVNPGDMQIHLMVIPVREGLLVYGTMSARTRDAKSFIDRARDSFTNRVVALTSWYETRITEEFNP
jgi:hypothetical protein